VAQVVEYLPNKHEALNSTLNSALPSKKKKKKNKLGMLLQACNPIILVGGQPLAKMRPYLKNKN
jgi:hypothetical protein